MHIQKKYLPIIISTAIALGIFIGGKLSFTDKSDRFFTSNSKKDKINRLIDYIDYEYVDEINTDSIVDVTVNRILENLDPHSTYIPKKDLQKVTDNMKGDFVGIGVSFYTYRDSVTVIRALEGGPSKKAGIKGGDRIVVADGDSIFGPNWSNDDIVAKLKGEKNTKVNLKVYRRGESKLLDFKVKRSEVPIKSVEASYMLSDNLGYIKVNRFAESTYKEFKKGLNNLQNQGATKLVLDLRDNPGGFLNQAEKIADEFLEDDKLILFTKNKKGAILIGILVLSHWVLDFIGWPMRVINPDLSGVPLLFSDLETVGLGVYSTWFGALTMDIGVFAVGFALYLHYLLKRKKN